MRFVRPSRVEGTLSAPPSKSMMVRAVLAACLARGISKIKNPSFCDDAQVALRAAGKLGAAVRREDAVVCVSGGELRPGRLDCGESGLCIRLLCALAPLAGGETILSGRGSLRARPLGGIEGPLAALGVDCETNTGRLPVVLRGALRGGHLLLDASITSQFLSGLLMALPLCWEDSSIEVSRLHSIPYVRMTLELCEHFGISIGANQDYTCFEIPGRQEYRAGCYDVEGDFSGAAFMLVAGAVAGSVVVKRLDSGSLQADRAILDALVRAGARVEEGEDFVSIEASTLRSFSFDATECPDLFPPLVALACSCSGTTEITGVGRLRHKESDRAQALVEEFSKLGASIDLNGDQMRVSGTILAGGTVDSHDDHRIAMACAIGALRSRDGVKIRGPECVSKSYPDFFENLSAIGVELS
ncbi:MAG TPA: 3-phosphoshikimate 1-carboxyvinyltransferase [Myxococcota bacterium]|nr:3-phosphoshikimate 1-carboxyvinyltransferase [Myxococcota bacterium]